MPADLSVVICSLNGAPGVDRCLQALARQAGRSRIEIILVDDGSTDGTGGVGHRHGATVIRHQANRGLGAARNSGVHAATAPVVAFLDDDCEPEPPWAQQLLAGYRAGVMGVGGCLAPSAPPGFMRGYLSRHNPLAPLELDLARSDRLTYRLGLYLRRQWTPPAPPLRRDVYSLIGGNMSFRRQVLLDAGCFDERFRLAGDETDLCRRPLRGFPSGRLAFVPGARVVHHFEPSLRDTLRRSRCYGLGSARLYRKWPGQRPTFFPGPVITAAALLCARAPLLAAAVLAVPHAFSPQGLRGAVTGRRPACLPARRLRATGPGDLREPRLPGGALAFPSSLPGRRAGAGPLPQAPLAADADADAMTVSGLAYAPPSGPVTGPQGSGPVTRRTAGCLGGLALIAVLMLLRDWWAAQVLLAVLLLVVPGVILLRALRVPGQAIIASPVYLPCASLMVLLGCGLAVDLGGPLAGVTQPLRTGPLLAGFELICLALLASARNAPAEVAIPWRSLARPAWLGWPLVLPLAAAAGALRLTSRHGPGLAVTALLACAVLLVGSLTFGPRLGKPLLTVILYAAGLALMWSFSLRSDLVYGFDIAAEYHALQHTVLSGVWPTGAMLSVTVLPAELHALTGAPALLVFEVGYPAIAALFPVAIFSLAVRVLSCRWAFAAAAFTVVQSTFFQELPGLARQEIALLLFGALMVAVLDGRLPRRPQWALVLLLGLAMAVSHYSTTYLAIAILGLMLLLQWVTSWRRPVPRMTGAMAVAFAASLTGALLWYGPVTESAGNVGQFVSSSETAGLDLLPGQVGLLALAALPILIVLRLSGTAANGYNPERAFLQGTLVLGIVVAWSMQGLAGRSGKGHAVVVAAAATALTMLLANASGLVGAALGGKRADNLANSG